MGLTNKSLLKTQAELIRYEDSEGQNTAERIGKALVELVEAVDVSLTTEQSNRESADNSLSQTLNSTLTIANAAQAAATEAKTAASNASSAAKTAQETAENAQAAADDISESIGEAEGIAPLDSNAQIPVANLPDYKESYNDVIWFSEAKRVAIVPQTSLGAKGTDENRFIVFNLNTNLFVIGSQVVDEDGNITSTTYYGNWMDTAKYGSGIGTGVVPYDNKIYVATETNIMYRWNGSTLVEIGNYLTLGNTSGTAFPGDSGKTMQAQIASMMGKLQGVVIFNVNALIDSDDAFTSFESALDAVPEELRVYFGAIVTFLYSEDGSAGEWVTYQWHAQIEEGHSEEDWLDLELWAPFGGGGSSLGNVYNVTNEIPLDSGEFYLDLNADSTDGHNVLDAVYAAGVAALGMQITFAIGLGSWKTYQYIGVNTSETNFKNVANWLDLAGMSAGAEAILNVDHIAPRSVAGYYDKSSAIDAVLALKASTGIDYAKAGLIITFRSGEYTWEAYQFTGVATDFSSKELWKEFGGGGSVSTSDTPEDGGTDAFSTGGAYDMQQQSFDHLDLGQDADNYIISAVNKKGEEMGDSVTIPKSTGTGTVSGSTLSIFVENAAVYGAFGSNITTRIAVKSVTYDGDEEVLGVINKLEIVDATTGLVLYTDNTKYNSSATSTSWLYTLDFTSYFTEAAQRDFQIVVYDADGNVKRRTISVTAVDVTCTCVQTLNYTTASALEVGGSNKNINMYKFANNVSKQGVKVTTEIYFNGEWQILGQATITDSYTHSISIDPCNVLGGGETMEHGSYPIRIQGEDIASGVKGNTVYTAVMCVDVNSTTPIVALRFDDTNNGTVRLYDNLTLELAAYTPGQNSTTASVFIDGVEVSTLECQISQSYTVRKQIQGYATDGSETIEAYAVSGSAQTTPPISVIVSGSAISAVLKEGARFAYDFSTRSNSESDHTITDSGVTMTVNGSNWSSNGFCTYLKETTLRIAENVTAEIPYAPFGNASTERTNGMVLQFAFATNNIMDGEAKLMECYDADSGAGFYICGNKIVVSCKTGTPTEFVRSFRCGEKHTAAIVVEPSTITQERGSTEYATIKFYFDGEEVGAIGYVANSGAILNQKTISFDGTDGDFYLYYMLAYDSYYEWAQAFQNYLCKLTDTDAMIEEFDAEDVLDNQNRPTIDKLKEKGIPYYVVVAPEATFTSFDSDINTSTNFKCTLYYYDPNKPWRSFKAVNVRWRRQGTTSAKRPIKNDRFYLAKEKEWAVTPLYPDYTTDEALRAYSLMELGYVQVGDNTIPVKIITVKVDFSDSTNANDCGVCDMMNATFRAMGTLYMTPAQRAYDGTWKKGDVSLTGLEMNHSTANHPIAAFRATSEALTDAYFHAKGNWKEDKGEQVALGFNDTPGYNKGCLNYGDFIEFFGEDGETLDETMARFIASEGLDTSMPYVLSQYCGRDYRVMRYSGGEWARSTGSMKQVDGKWVIEGDVLNPVSGFELLTYDGMDWFMGVGSVEDMMAPTTTESSWITKLNLGQSSYPAWTQYFECMVDDDQLQIDLAMGRKVPYDLYNVMQFCNSCDYSQDELADTWEAIWKNNAWRYMSIQSLLSYYTFTDYLAAVDQQAKNMQPMFFLEDGCSVENGVYSSPSTMEPIRMYFNKVYDCDTCNGKDNDGGNTIPSELDPENDTKCYAGRGSILWNNLRRCENQEMICDASGNTLTLPGVVAAMRNLPEVDGIGAGPFSPAGANYYFLTKRILKWPKVVSSYDGERKYIKYTGYNDIYYYALQGSGRQSLPAFIEQRWRIRDGYYQTGDFKDASHVLSGRIGAKDGAVITFKAAKSGYFGIGNDGGNVTQGMYLQAGEEGVFTDFQHGDNILLYIYQADQMSEIDLSQISLDPNFQFSQMKLAEKIVIGSDVHKDTWTLSPGNTGFLTTMNLGELPFLRHLDVRQTEVTSINASKCPRLETVLASDSDLTSISLAETSPVSTLELPGGMTELNLVNLPQLTYPGGLTMASFEKVNRLMLSGCPYIDQMSLINGIISASSIRYIRLPDLNITAQSSILATLKASGAIGLDPTGSAYEESGKCSGMTGRWIMEDLISDSELASYAAYFPQLEIYNSQYSCVCFDDTDEDSANITNLDNGTSKDDYVASGHFVKIFDNAHPYKTTFDSREAKLLATQISDSNYTLMADGSEYDPTDQAGEGFDVMLGFGLYWYKGVDDFKNQKKYLFACSYSTEPLSTATKTNRQKLSDIVVKELSCIYTTTNGEALQQGDSYEIVDNANMNVHAIDVEGMKQVRFPGINNAQIGAVFVDEDDKVISTFNMAVSHSLFDFTVGEDYVFCDVPSGAKRLIFTAPINAMTNDLEAIAVDSAAIEAIEPDWVWVPMRFVGIYGMSVDALMRPRSISGVKTQTGTGTSTTNADWTYDSDGNVSNATAPTSTMNYTYGDMLNLCELRGAGYHSISYEISKDIANLVMALTGTRDIQAYAGYGCGSSYTTGQNSFNTYGKVTRKYSGSNIGNIIFGIQNFVGCNTEVMDFIACNVTSFTSFKKNKRIGISTDPVDAVYHVRDPFTLEERAIQGLSTNSGYCVARVKFGRYCDVIASRYSTDSSKFNQHYSDGQFYTASTGRCVSRSYHYSNADGGLVYSYAHYASSYSFTNSGARLAFSGNYEIASTE